MPGARGRIGGAVPGGSGSGGAMLQLQRSGGSSIPREPREAMSARWVTPAPIMRRRQCSFVPQCHDSVSPGRCFSIHSRSWMNIKMWWCRRPFFPAARRALLMSHRTAWRFGQHAEGMNNSIKSFLRSVLPGGFERRTMKSNTLNLYIYIFLITQNSKGFKENIQDKKGTFVSAMLQMHLIE